MDRRDMSYDDFTSFDARSMIATIEFAKETEDGDYEDLTLHCHYEVCGTCHGKGHHVNPSIDSHGISSDEFYEDPDFAESYFRGDYNQTCVECHGNNVVPVPDEDDPNIKHWNDYLQGKYEMYAEMAAERRAGC